MREFSPGHVARLSEQCELEVEAVMLLFAVLKNMTTDSDTCRLALMRHAALTTTTAWVRALVLLYYCFTSLLLLYYCFTTALLLYYSRSCAAPPSPPPPLISLSLQT
jgi:hypothetical protein